MNKYNPELVKDPGQAAADYVEYGRQIPSIRK